MSREIKFRAWDNVDYMSTPFTLQDLQLKKVQFTSDCQLMQFTGLQDKNGKDIYEGDVVTEGYHNKYGTFQVEWDKCGFNLNTGGDGFFTVIGNIYENQELLTNP